MLMQHFSQDSYYLINSVNLLHLQQSCIKKKTKKKHIHTYSRIQYIISWEREVHNAGRLDFPQNT